MVVVFSALMALGSQLVTADFLGADQPTDLLGLGMIATVLLEVTGYGIAWAGWWIARR